MAQGRTAAVGQDCPAGPDEIFNALIMSAMAGCRAMAIVSDQDDDTSILAKAIGSRMEAAGATVMVVIARPGATLQNLLDQVSTPASGKGEIRSPVRHEALVQQLLQGEDAGLLIVTHADALDAGLLESLLSLSQVVLGDGRFLQVLLAGDAGLNAHLDSLVENTTGRPAGVRRWLLASSPIEVSTPIEVSAPIEASVPKEASAPKEAFDQDFPEPASATRYPLPAPPFRLLRHIGALGILFLTTIGVAWSSADHFLAEPVAGSTTYMDAIEKFGDAGGYEAIEPVVGQDQTLAMELLVSGATGSKPSLRPGQTVVVRLETTTDKFVYCFYKDGYGRVMRIFPNRFQSNDFVPAGQSVEIPPGPERPFNIRLDKAGQVEAIACLASSTKVDPDLIGDAKSNDLAPIPSLELEGILQAFKRLSGSGSSTVTMPIKVMNDPKGWSEAGLVGSWPSMSLSNVQPSRP